MAWNFTTDKPIYVQIVETMKQDIFRGHYKSGDRLPSVRELAMEAAVNPNTMQRAFAQLEQEGLIETQRNTGRTVTTNQTILNSSRESMAETLTLEYLNKMKSMGSNPQDAIRLIEKLKKEI